MLKRIAIVGAGGFGREVFQLVNKDIYKVIGFIDSHLGLKNLAVEIIGGDSMIPKLIERNLAEGLCIAVGNGKIRRKIFDTSTSSKIPIFQIVHSSIVNMTSIPLGRGTIVYPNVVIMNETKIGDCVLLNSGVTLGHNVEIGNFSNINPGVNLAGGVTIGEESIVGIGSSVKENITIGNQVVVGAGSVVVNDIPDRAIAFGVPAKIHKYL